jgi:predicted secreted Zn-dependent protease
MLIVNDEQRLRAGVGSLSKRCQYCSKALAAYPLILSDDARLVVYHAACAVQLATEIMVDLYTFPQPACPLPPALCAHATWRSSRS